MSSIKIKILSVFVLLFIISSSIVSSMNLNQSSNEFNFELASLLEGGFLEERDGIKILYVSGSYYQMGYQHGYLLRDEIQQNLRAALADGEKIGIDEDKLKETWDIVKEYRPPEIFDELQGIADGANISYEEINYFNLFSIIGYTDPFSQQCSGFAAWGPATADGELILVSSADMPLNSEEDPVSGKRVQENQVVVVRNPEDGHASIYFALAGCYGWDGINSEGIGIVVLASSSASVTYKAVPIGYRVHLALDKASTAEEAIEIIRQSNDLGWNVIVSDAKVPVAYVLEMNADTTYIGTYDNPCESYMPFWEIDHVIRRTNFYISRSLAATQRDHYSPRSLLLMLLGQNIFYPVWRLYLGLSKGIQNNWGSMNMDNSLEILMNAYTGETDHFIYFIQRFGPINTFVKKKGMGFLQPLNQFATSPKTGDILVTLAGRDTVSYENPVHSLNLLELVDYFENYS